MLYFTCKFVSIVSLYGNMIHTCSVVRKIKAGVELIRLQGLRKWSRLRQLYVDRAKEELISGILKAYNSYISCDVLNVLISGGVCGVCLSGKRPAIHMFSRSGILSQTKWFNSNIVPTYLLLKYLSLEYFCE